MFIVLARKMKFWTTILFEIRIPAQNCKNLVSLSSLITYLSFVGQNLLACVAFLVLQQT